MANLVLPLSVEVVGHDVDVVEVLGQLGDVVSRCNGFETGGNGGCQKELGIVGRLTFPLKGQAKFFNQRHEGRSVVGPSRILPINVEAIEVVAAQELDGVVDEAVHAEGVRRQSSVKEYNGKLIHAF